MQMSIDREELKKAVELLPEEKLVFLQRYLRILQKSSLLEEGPSQGNQGDPVLNVLGCLSGEPLTAQQIEEELYGWNDSHV
jgi:hypothetical protein